MKMFSSQIIWLTSICLERPWSTLTRWPRKIGTQNESVKLHSEIWIQNSAPQSLLILHWSLREFELEFSFSSPLHHSCPLHKIGWIGSGYWLQIMWKRRRKRKDSRNRGETNASKSRLHFYAKIRFKIFWKVSDFTISKPRDDCTSLLLSVARWIFQKSEKFETAAWKAQGCLGLRIVF